MTVNCRDILRLIRSKVTEASDVITQICISCTSPNLDHRFMSHTLVMTFQCQKVKVTRS